MDQAPDNTTKTKQDLMDELSSIQELLDDSQLADIPVLEDIVAPEKTPLVATTIDTERDNFPDTTLTEEEQLTLPPVEDLDAELANRSYGNSLCTTPVKDDTVLDEIVDDLLNDIKPILKARLKRLL